MSERNLVAMGVSSERSRSCREEVSSSRGHSSLGDPVAASVSGSIAGRKKGEGTGDRRSKQRRKAEEEDEQRSSSSRILSGYKTDWFSPLPLGIHILDMPLWAIDTGTGPSGTLGPWAGVISNANKHVLGQPRLPCCLLCYCCDDRCLQG